MSEQLQKLIPKQRQQTYEYSAPFPVPPIEVKVSDELLDKLLEQVDEAVGEV